MATVDTNTYLLGRDISYFVKKKKYSETDIINMLEFLNDNIIPVFGGRIFQQTVSIPMVINCVPLLADLFLCSCEANFKPLKTKTEKTLALSFNNSKFGDFVDLIYPIELEIKDTTDTVRYPSYIDLHLKNNRVG